MTQYLVDDGAGSHITHTPKPGTDIPQQQGHDIEGWEKDLGIFHIESSEYYINKYLITGE